jgi:hypothetical protein
MVSTLKVNTIQRQSGTSIAIGESGDTITITAGASLTGPIAAAGLTGALPAISGASLTALNATELTSGTLPDNRFPATLPAVSGASLTNLPAETKPTISSISPSVITNASTAVTITGTNFISVPIVEAINSTGVITQADSVAFTNVTTIVATFTLPTDGTYYLRIENNDGNAVRSGTALLTVSDVPSWVTGSGSLGSFAGGGSVGTITLVCTDATSFAIQSGALPGGVSLSSAGVITGTESGASATTTYSFTVRATDAEGQTADRAFSIEITFGISNSLRFHQAGSGDGTALYKTNVSGGSYQKFTISMWYKRGIMTNVQYLMYGAPQTGGQCGLSLQANGELQFREYDSGAGGESVVMETKALYRDPTAWYHFVAAIDTTQTTAADRVKLYVNGVQSTLWETNTQPSQHENLYFNYTNDSDRIMIGSGSWNVGDTTASGYFAHVHFCDSNQYAASDFGETDSTTGIWKPIITPSVTYGSNGFFLKFENSGALGTDSSGNSNTFTVDHAPTNGQTVDTPSNNFCVLNPVDKGGNVDELTQGNLYLYNGSTSGQADEQHVRGTLSVVKGKWYWEMKFVNNNPAMALLATEEPLTTSLTSATIIMSQYTASGYISYRNASGQTDLNTGVSTYTTNDILGCALDLDNDKAYFSKNGTWQGDPTPVPATNSSAAGNHVPIPANVRMAAMAMDDSSGSAGDSRWNFGNPIVTISSNSGNGYADGDGYGKFEYEPPSGFYALCTKNINTYG